MLTTVVVHLAILSMKVFLNKLRRGASVRDALLYAGPLFTTPVEVYLTLNLVLYMIEVIVKLYSCC